MMDLGDFYGKKICVAVSGGVDSVCLLHYMKSREKSSGYTVYAVHCEHGIRGEESLSDAAFVAKICKEWGIVLYTYSADCPTKADREKVSLETAARRFRQEVFATIIEEGKADFIATAHHKNDDAETVLFRLARGTSLSGVGGMSAMNGYILRPFLGKTRAEIEEYARENGLSFCVDSTNEERDATRNKLRLDVLPKLEEAVPGALGGLVRFSEIAREDDEFLYRLAEDLVERQEETVLVHFSDSKPLFRRACMLALKTLGVSQDYTLLHLERAWALQTLERGAKQTMLKGVEAKKETQGIRFYLLSEAPTVEKGEEQLFALGQYEGGRYAVNVTTTPPNVEDEVWKTLRFDREQLPATAVYRYRREGDYIRRFGGGTKSLKKFFNEEKVPVEAREYLPLLAEKDGAEVYAVCGVEISERIKVTDSTKTIAYITMK